MNRQIEDVRAALVVITLVAVVAVGLSRLFGNESSLFRGDLSLGVMAVAVVFCVFLITPASDKVLKWICRR